MPLCSPPIHQIAQARLERYFGLKAKQALSLRCRSQTARHRINGPLGSKLWGQAISAHHHSERLCQLRDASFLATRNVEHFIADIRFRTQNVGARHVANVYEVHRLLAVAEYDRRLTSRQPLHPSNEHLGISAMDIHAFPIDVEIPECDVVEPIHIVECAE